MRGVNELTIVGNLGGDPEVRTTGGGTVVATFSVGVNAREKRQGEWQDHTEWFRVVCWGSTAEAIGKYLRKGAPVLVLGRLRTEQWKDQDGNDRRSTKVYARGVTFLGGGQREPGDERQQQGNRSGTEPQGDSGYGGGQGGGQSGPGGPDDDIPF